LKGHLDEAIAQDEKIASAVERASEPDGDAGSPRKRTFALSIETPDRRRPRVPQIPFGDDREPVWVRAMIEPRTYAANSANPI
jgi:hypothetical protein